MAAAAKNFHKRPASSTATETAAPVAAFTGPSSIHSLGTHQFEWGAHMGCSVVTLGWIHYFVTAHILHESLPIEPDTKRIELLAKWLEIACFLYAGPNFDRLRHEPSNSAVEQLIVPAEVHRAHPVFLQTLHRVNELDLSGEITNDKESVRKALRSSHLIKAEVPHSSFNDTGAIVEEFINSGTHTTLHRAIELLEEFAASTFSKMVGAAFCCRGSTSALVVRYLPSENKHVYYWTDSHRNDPRTGIRSQSNSAAAIHAVFLTSQDLCKYILALYPWIPPNRHDKGGENRTNHFDIFSVIASTELSQWTPEQSRELLREFPDWRSQMVRKNCGKNSELLRAETTQFYAPVPRRTACQLVSEMGGAPMPSIDV